MTKEQLIKIAKAGFPKRVKQFIDFKNVELHKMGDVYRLYDKNVEFRLVLPKETILDICFIKENNWIQFTMENHYAFNHLAAIRKMEQLKLI